MAFATLIESFGLFVSFQRFSFFGFVVSVLFGMLGSA